LSKLKCIGQAYSIIAKMCETCGVGTAQRGAIKWTGIDRVKPVEALASNFEEQEAMTILNATPRARKHLISKGVCWIRADGL
jgi:hypothetical protein